MMQLPQTHYISNDHGCYWLIPVARQSEWNQFLELTPDDGDSFYNVPDWAEPMDLEKIDAMDMALPARVAA